MRLSSAAGIAAWSSLVTLCAGCGAASGFFSYGDGVEVVEVRQVTVCNSIAGVSRLTPLADGAALREWETERHVELSGGETGAPTLPPGPYVVVEHGTRVTGGYGLVVSRRATVSGNELTLYATYLSPGENQMRSQMVTSPCALVALPAGSRYDRLILLDQSGAVRARFPDAPPPAAIPTAVPAQ